jgi:hypothetical protein
MSGMNLYATFSRMPGLSVLQERDELALHVSPSRNASRLPAGFRTLESRPVNVANPGIPEVLGGAGKRRSVPQSARSRQPAEQKAEN